MSQHSWKPYYVEDDSDLPMWDRQDDKLIHRITSSRKSFRTTISKSLVESLKVIANEKNTRINYLLESGMEKVLKQEIISFNKFKSPKDRIQYKTTYDNKLLVEVKLFAKINKLYINDVIEYSVQFIEVEKNSNNQKGPKITSLFSNFHFQVDIIYIIGSYVSFIKYTHDSEIKTKKMLILYLIRKTHLK